jgi:hypothetical protein
MPARQYISTAEAKTLSAGINNAVTSITLNSVTTLPGSYPYTLVIDPDTTYEEIVTVTASGGGNLLTVTRGQDGTSAQSHNAAAVVRHMITARDLQEPQNHINASSDVHGLATAGPAGASGGVVVGTTASQTLTNKTIASPVITGTISGTGVVSSTNILDGTITGTDIASGTIAGNNIASGTITSSNILDGTIVNADINSSAAIADTKLATITTDGKVANSATTATVNNTGQTIVLRNSSGNFIAGTITADLSGNASSASVLSPGRSINGITFNGSAAINTHVGGQGTTSATAVTTVTHGLGIGVAPSSVVATHRTSGTTGSPRIFYVSRLTATQFDIYALDTAGGQVAAPFYWIAIA